MNLERVDPGLRPLVTRFIGDLDGLMGQLATQQITADSWEEAFSTLIARYHIAALIEAKGSAIITPSMSDWLARMVDVQLGFLAGFTAVINATGNLRPVVERLTSRARLYSLAIKTAWHMGDIIRQVGRPLPLPAMPTQGTQCGNNCGCGWEIVTLDETAGDYDAYWVRKKDDSCQTCIQRELEWNGPAGDRSDPVRIRGLMLV